MNTIPITDLAKVIRGKNAGPLDIIFKEKAGYEQTVDSGVINEDLISNLYGISKEGIINIVSFPQALAIKATIVRSRPSGAFGDTDVYGAQQHAPLLSIMVPVIS